MLICNTGKPLNMLEQGFAFQRLIEYGWKQAEIAKKTGKSQGHVSNCVILAKAPKKLQNLVIEGKMESSALLRSIRETDDPELIVAAVEEVNGNTPEKAENAPSEPLSEEEPTEVATPAKKAKKASGSAVSDAINGNTAKPKLKDKLKEIEEWIEENSIILKDSSEYAGVKKAFDFLIGKSTSIEIK